LFSDIELINKFVEEISNNLNVNPEDDPLKKAANEFIVQWNNRKKVQTYFKFIGQREIIRSLYPWLKWALGIKAKRFSGDDGDKGLT